MTTESEISRFYDGKNVFITGATGFMGKVLVEKLLRSCENVNKIYILIRNKKGKNLEERRIAFIEHLVFNKLRENEPQVLDKVHPISGDVSIDGLEMNENDQKLLIEDVNIVFHCAANVRFDLSLRDAVNFNVLGTQRVLTLAEKMKNLQVFLHVSTTFCHCNESTLEERYYPANDNPFGIIEMVKNLKDETLELITPKLLNGLPNTYAYTKGLTEDLVHSYMNKLPIAIARPSIVISSWKEPFEGWIEGFQGPAAISLAAAKGIIRSMNCFPDFKSQTVPVDIIINAIIVIAHKRSKMGLNDEYYCNLSDYTNPPATWGQILELGRDMIKEYPMSQCLWYPGGSFKKNYYVHLIYSFLFHLLPAYFIDFMMIIFGQKPFLVDVQKKVSLGHKVLRYYTTRAWNFKHDNFEKLLSEMSEVDKEKFCIDMNRIDLNEYVKNYIIGIRVHLANDSLDTLPKARRLFNILFYLDLFVKVFFTGISSYIIWIIISNYF